MLAMGRRQRTEHSKQRTTLFGADEDPRCRSVSPLWEIYKVPESSLHDTD